MVAIAIINHTVLDDFRRTLELIAGPAQLEITLGSRRGRVPRGHGRHRARRSRRRGGARPRARHARAGGRSRRDARALRRRPDAGGHARALPHRARRGGSDTLEWLADPRSIALTASFAASHGLGVGDRLRLSTRRGAGRRSPCAACSSRRASRGRSAASLAVMDLPAAQMASARTTSSTRSTWCSGRASHRRLVQRGSRRRSRRP